MVPIIVNCPMVKFGWIALTTETAGDSTALKAATGCNDKVASCFYQQSRNAFLALKVWMRGIPDMKHNETCEGSGSPVLFPVLGLDFFQIRMN